MFLTFFLSKPILRTILIAVLFSLFAFSSTAKQFYVSPLGNDKNQGNKENPFATLERAKVAVEKSIQKNNNQDFTIWMAAGTYAIENPIVFKSEFFTEKVQLKIIAETKTETIISGGIQLNNWKKNGNGIWETQLPQKQDWNPRELFIEGQRAVRARFPNTDYMRVKKVGIDRRTNFFFEKEDFPIPENLDAVELVLLHDWSISRIGIKKIDPNLKQLIAIDTIGTKNLDFFNLDNWEKNPRYYLENAPEFLDADFEWYFDVKTGKIYLKLPESQNPETLKIVVPVSSSLIQVEGTKSTLAKNIHFEGITFQNCSWEIPAVGYCGVQACNFDARPKKGWREIPAALKLEWAENCSFDRCFFENMGTSGIWFSMGCKMCSVSNSEFYDISGNGIMIGEGNNRLVDGEVWWKNVPEEIALGNTIENCKIRKCGTQFYGAVGIWCGFTAQTTIKDNEISDLPYSGISIGWEWSPIPTPCRENVIDGNHIHHILKILSDGGGIYSLGLQPGSKLINNHIHDVKINAGRAESNGMFLDEGTTDVIVANNLIYNIAKSPLRFHKATTNLVKNNYLFCTGDNPPIRYNRTTEEDITKVDNKVYSELEYHYKKELEKMIKVWTE